ncbi:HlyD family secretion protein [Mesorhizobium sp. PAMC28654]|uniref:HlyD family secretion protein n=1 Tax=Mesorhizobium sp. PAMC28654 TaxID=2880934 RepID=UPI001D09AC0D|nr:HlyD family secretion protein [Mesorhizobium sp. PAMC28654]UDL87053.1 HlyD family secretion protein [Mesorhizobium sp. PAMC28654]
MTDSTSPKKYEEEPVGDAPSAARSSDQVIRLASERGQRKASTVVEDDELEAPVALEPAALEAPSTQPPPTQPQQAPVAVAPQVPVKPRRSLRRPLLFALLPVALVVGGYYYVTGGQVMTTDNAYIQAQSLGVSTDVSGTVSEINVHDNQVVKKGDVLFRLRPASFETALAAAQAQLGTVRNQVLTLQASYQQSQAQIDQAQADIPYYEAAFARQQDLLKTSTASKATFDSAQHDLVAARQKVSVAKAQAQAMLAQLGDASQPIEKNPFYLQAQSAVDDAQRNLNDSIVKAPFDGIVTNVDALQVGKYLPASQPAFSLVSATDLWISAEPKETELTYVRPGQTATISVDTYPGTVWHGTVASISPASSSSFSLLPAQNTTGNWVKVVQRIPMRVTVDDTQDKPPLRGGMSVVVGIDTGHARGLPDFVTDLMKRLGIAS